MDKDLQDTIREVEKIYGKGSIMTLGDCKPIDVDVISTGVNTLDKALGAGGYPKGRIIELYGPEASGKTTLALYAVASCQKAGGQALYIDAEHSMNPEYAHKVGVDLDKLLFSQPDSGEQALSIAESVLKGNAISLIVIDSVAALVPEAELNGEMTDNNIGLQARMMSKAMRKLTALTAKSNCTLIFINQLREKIGVMYGNPETQPGGRALKFYSTIRLDVRKGEPIKKGTDVIGNKVNIKIVKNKVYPPFKTASVDLIYGEGFDNIGSIVDSAVEADIINKSGSWYSYNGDKIGQGRDATRDYFKAHPELIDELNQKLKAQASDQNNQTKAAD